MKKKTIDHIKFIGECAEDFNANLRTHALEEQTKFDTRINENEDALAEIENEVEKHIYDF
tara:strand:- start:6 stop:185 length:180 start_codon:yes stop_codon:yes gene_type:complete